MISQPAPNEERGGRGAEDEGRVAMLGKSPVMSTLCQA